MSGAQDSEDVSSSEKHLIETLEEMGTVILHDSGTVHLSMECQHVDRYDVGGPNSLEYKFRNVDSEAVIRVIENTHRNDESLCSVCDSKWGLNGELV